MLIAMAISTFFIIISVTLVGKISSRQFDDLNAVQATHSRPTSRLGGLAIFFGIIAIYFEEPLFLDSSVLIFSSIPIFIIGLMEDLTGKVAPSIRLIASVCSAALAIFYSGAFLDNVDVFFLDKILVFAPVGILFTLLASSGVVNSFNLIDGLNGFVGGLGIIMAIALGYLCNLHGEQSLSRLCFFIAAALIPFLIFNFPFGFIFLGDSGAYLLGHILCWIALILIVRHPELSSWAILLIFAWPITDTLFSMFRRFRSKKSSAAADKFHFHHLVLQFFLLKFNSLKINSRWANPISTAFLWPIASAPIACSLLKLTDNLVSFAFYITFVIVFVFAYLGLVEIVRSLAKKNGEASLVLTLSHIFRPEK